MRKGVTLVELSIVLVITGIILVTVFVIAPKLMTGSKSDNIVGSFSGVQSALETVKSSNAGAYPAQAAAAAFSAGPAALYNELGGANGTKDLAGWTYRCPAGAGQSLVIVTSNMESTEVAKAALTKLNGRMAPWVATLSGTALTITKSNVTCQ